MYSAFAIALTVLWILAVTTHHTFDGYAHILFAGAIAFMCVRYLKQPITPYRPKHKERP